MNLLDNMLINIEEMLNKKSHELIPFNCIQCNNHFERLQKYIKNTFNRNKINSYKFCSKQCCGRFSYKKQEVICSQCSKKFIKSLCEIKQSSNHFCNHSCNAIYQNTHKTKGTRVSKLEVYLAAQLIILYPKLEFHFNQKDTISSELDIYIPELKLAFELNGIFHYEPIYGDEKLNQIQNNDNRKMQACLENQIELCIIDSSKLTYFKESNAIKYLNIITNIIDKKLTR